MRLLPHALPVRPADTREVGQLLASPVFRQSVAEVAEQRGMSRDEAMAEAVGYLREMSGSHQPQLTDAWLRFGNWLTRGYDILVDEDGMAELRRLDRKHSLIFLISHRSYLDEFIIQAALPAGGLSPLFGMAGANLDFFPLGTVARRTGVVHVRRATADMPIYRLALRAYMGQLVENKANLGWSIEGGRTRTGKLRPPRYGLMRYVADAVESLPDADPLIVPVSCMYDQLPIHEVGKMASEARGQRKESEDLRWLVGYARGLRERLGRMYLDFGKPLPLRQRLTELASESVAAGSDGANDNRVERVALAVCHRINSATPVTPTAAVCIALLAADRALTLDEVLDTVRPLAVYIRGRGWPVAGGANLTDRSTLRWALRELVRSGVLTCYTGGNETVWAIGADQHLVAAVYRNSAIHVLLMRAIVELSVLALAESGDPSTLMQTALRLRELLKFDFFFSRRIRFEEDLAREIEVLARPAEANGLEVTPDQARAWLDNAIPLVSHLVLRPFLDAYRVVAEQLAGHDDDDEIDERALIGQCLRVGRQWTLQRTLASEESVSGEMFGTALKLAGHLDLLRVGAPDLAKRRRQFADELGELGRAVGRIAERDRIAKETGFPTLQLG
jgi:glycerol-3-phosphate O-acyltransferase